MQAIGRCLGSFVEPPRSAAGEPGAPSPKRNILLNTHGKKARIKIKEKKMVEEGVGAR